MDKQAILSLLTKPSGNEMMFSKIVQAYLSNIKCSKNYAVMNAVTVPPAPGVSDNETDVVVRTHKRLYTEVLEVLVDKFNQCSDQKIFSTETNVEEFVETMVPFLHKFYTIHQGEDPQTDEKYPVQQLEISYKEDDDNDTRWIEMTCTVVQHTTNLYNVVRELNMKFYVQ